ncbi:MAG: FecR domain-containing protein [Acidobacteriota bacterium]
MAIAAVVVLLIGAVVMLQRYANRERPSWNVVRVQGTKEIAGRLSEGEWMDTNNAGRARIDVGEIGIVEIEPNSRVRLVAAKPGEGRITLQRGELSAVISAPPRLFFVETPSSLAVDLGCAYRMKTDDQGNGQLHVTSGWVSLESDGHDSLVPAGAMCLTRRGLGPGTPYFEDAPAPLRQALDAFDVDRAQTKTGVLDTILNAARVRDTLTLWHLLSKTTGNDRLRVFDRMTALVPLPSAVTRDKVLTLDPEALKHWREELAWKW